jgi:hypothetical protein
MDESFALTRQVTATVSDTEPAREVPGEFGTVAVFGTVVVAFVRDGELFEGDTTVCADRLFPAGRFKDGFSNRYGHHMLARAGLVLPRRTFTVRWDSAFDVNRVGVVVGVRMGVVDHLYVAVTEKRERKRLPLRSLLGRHVGVEYVHHVGRG